MDSEKRRDHRQALKYPAKIDLGDGTPHLVCILTDVSASGARITLEGGNFPEIPDHFTLLLAAEHGTLRRCKLVWREDNQIGLAFLKAPPAKPLRPRAPREAAGT